MRNSIFLKWHFGENCTAARPFPTNSVNTFSFFNEKFLFAKRGPVDLGLGGYRKNRLDYNLPMIHLLLPGLFICRYSVSQYRN